MERARAGLTPGVILILSFISLLSWSCIAANGEGGGEGSINVSPQCDRKNCTSVQGFPCKNGTITFALNQCITEEHEDCEVGIYDKDCDKLLDKTDLSRLLKHQNVTLNFCPSEFCLKLQCTDKKNDLVFCFRGINDTSPDSQSQMSNGAYELWLIPLAVGVVFLGIVVCFVVWLVKKFRSQKGKKQSVAFSEVNQEDEQV
ncbi:uncharacterized protein LOC108413128 isoform X2 [Pygocentrus nattereri]|uniref:uncharacterized protein LOC108413128 isoform X2 n=1 Tax=Pygocentrus nattereri TaxID=42514 RepID=UPI00081421A3|nr:uncharacterized protein LOC108413128 isoform X2 [Pygocentrus nattereri]